MGKGPEQTPLPRRHTNGQQIHYFAVYMGTHIFSPNFQEKKNFHFSFLIQLFIYLYLETKLIIIFQSIILHTILLLLSRVHF